MTDEIAECYRLLEVEPGAPLDVVKSARRDLLKIWHPDRFPNDPRFQRRATEKAKAINEAYQKLTAYLSGNYRESRASAGTRAAEEAARQANEAAEAKAHEEARRGEEARRRAEQHARQEQDWRTTSSLNQEAAPPPVAPSACIPPKPKREAGKLPTWCWPVLLAGGLLYILVIKPQLQYGDWKYPFWPELRRIQFMAERGEAWAQFQLAWRYFKGEGVVQNWPKAAEWYAKAAQEGHAAAQNNLGVMYQNCQAVPRDYVEAYKWYCLAAAQGDTDAVTNRDNLLRFLSPEQFVEGQRAAAAFVPRKPGAH
jgi:TPR repeat protein